MAPKTQQDENIVNNNNNNKGDSPEFKLNIEDTAVHVGNTDSNSTNNRYEKTCLLNYGEKSLYTYIFKCVLILRSQFSSMSDEESYECYGEGDMETSSPVDNVLTKFVQICIMCLTVATRGRRGRSEGNTQTIYIKVVRY